MNKKLQYIQHSLGKDILSAILVPSLTKDLRNPRTFALVRIPFTQEQN
jgi:hypothetical protein